MPRRDLVSSQHHLARQLPSTLNWTRPHLISGPGDRGSVVCAGGGSGEQSIRNNGLLAKQTALLAHGRHIVVVGFSPTVLTNFTTATDCAVSCSTVEEAVQPLALPPPVKLLTTALFCKARDLQLGDGRQGSCGTAGIGMQRQSL